MGDLKRTYSHCEHTNCYTYFRMTGDFDPDKISELLGLSPDECWKIGDTMRGGKQKYKFSCWKFGTCKEYDVYVENQMLKTIAPLLSKVEILREIKRQFHVNFFLEVVPTVRYDESTPCLAPSLQVMQFCCDTGTEMDIDLYVSCPDNFDDGLIFED